MMMMMRTGTKMTRSYSTSLTKFGRNAPPFRPELFLLRGLPFGRERPQGESPAAGSIRGFPSVYNTRASGSESRLECEGIGCCGPPGRYLCGE